MVVGPTGVGKSDLAIRLARRFDGEIINADSRQIYRYLDIGTAKPAACEMRSVPHHLFDIIEPDEDYSLAQYQQAADAILRAIWRRYKIPILAGGSGQYVMGLLEGWQVPRVPPDLELRKSLEQKAAEDSHGLYRQLSALDPQAAQKIDPRNIRRVIRALEVCLRSGDRFSQMQTKTPPDYQPLIIGLTMDRAELYRRTDSRVEEMFRLGLLDETDRLLKKGYHAELPSLSSIGYRQAAAVIRQEMTLAQAVLKIQTETHRYIRHQYAWFKLDDHRIQWFDAGQEIWNDVERTVSQFLSPSRSE